VVHTSPALDRLAAWLFPKGLEGHPLDAVSSPLPFSLPPPLNRASTGSTAYGNSILNASVGWH
jgi:hypothetical protein